MTANLLAKRCVFFDFDGVIADSVDAKIDAFGELYRPFGEDVRQKVMAYQRAHPGETRYEKIPMFHRDLLGVALNEGDIELWCERLSDIVLDQVVRSALLPDVMDVLITLRLQGIAAHVVSGTPHDELQIIVDRKGLRGFFRTVRGSPEHKDVIVRDIMARDALTADDCIFVGDAMTDHACAQACAIDFVGVAPGMAHPFPQGTFVVDRLGRCLGAAVEERPVSRPVSRRVRELAA